MKNYNLLMLLALCLSTPLGLGWASADDAKGAPKICTATKEYITTLEYLRAQKSFNLPEAEAQKLASLIATGCSGAAGRFIKTVNVLSQAEMTTPDAIEIGKTFAALSDDHAAAFLSAFKGAFLSDLLDLDFRTATQLAISLSAEYSGNLVASQKDFANLVKFCVREESLNLQRPACATFAARLTRVGTGWEDKGVSKAFFELYEFLRSEKGPGLITGQALSVAEEVLSKGLAAPQNFMQAYRYSVAKKGLSLPVNDALAFSRKMASQSVATAPSKE